MVVNEFPISFSHGRTRFSTLIAVMGIMPKNRSFGIGIAIFEHFKNINTIYGFGGFIMSIY